VKLDDIGLHLAERRNSAVRSFGRGLVHGVPPLLKGLAIIGTAAMLWVGGGILLHGLEVMHILEDVPHFVHDLAHAWAGGSGVLEWLLNAIGASIAGAIVGAPIVGAVHLWQHRPGARALSRNEAGDTSL
jgi:predicted DNA repair protein MutK